ncbi:MAG: DUF1284 domain-containing protein [Thermodesulfovibrionales bacterium]|nr:DUF1284 domain-containing protein [Thermodesulfovibrionales bacterium]
MTKLRGHHLICLHFFRGKGYDEKFVENLKKVLIKAEKGPVTACSGADDICRACPYLKGGICAQSEGSDKEIQAMDEMALKLLGLKDGGRTEWKAIKKRLPLIFPAWLKSWCRGCDWREACRKNPFYKA